MVMKLQIFMIRNSDSNHTCLAVISLDSVFEKDRNYYPKFFLKQCKYIEKKVVRHIIDDLESSSDDFDDSDDSDKEKIKAIKLIFFENIFFERVILKKIYFEIFWGGDENFLKSILKMYFLREKF